MNRIVNRQDGRGEWPRRGARLAPLVLSAFLGCAGQVGPGPDDNGAPARDGGPILRRIRPADTADHAAAPRRPIQTSPRLIPGPDGLPPRIVAAGSHGIPERVLISFPGIDALTALHPDGRRLVFAAETGRGRDTELYLVRDDGTGLVRLTRNAAPDRAPRFDAGGRLTWETGRWHGTAHRAVADLVVPAGSEDRPAICAGDAIRHVATLASEDMEGRLAGTLGDAMAASYVAGCFDRFGLEPGGDGGSWFQGFAFTYEMRPGPGNALAVRIGDDRIEARPGRDFLPVLFTKIDSVAAEAVAAGYGIVLPDGREDDYADWTTKGRVAVVLDGSPAGWRKRPRADRIAAGLREKAAAASKRGASALLIVGELPKRAARRGSGGEKAPLPVVRVSRDFWDRVMKTAGGRDLPLRVSLTTDVVAVRRWTANVVGIWPGETDEAVVVGAHFDHLGFGIPGASLAGVTDRLHPGADDNASGVAGILEVAQAVAAAGKPLRRTIVFVAFAAEELGFLGSRRYIAHPVVPLERTVAMINLDMVGRATSKGLMVQGVGTSPVWASFEKALRKDADVKITIRRGGISASDHSAFYAKRIPILFFFSGIHKQYHRPTDTVDRVEAEGLAEVARWVREAAIRAATATERPGFIEVKPSRIARGGERAFLGIQPDFFAREEGVPVGGIIPGGPAEKAGLREDDVITRIGSKDVKEPDDLIGALIRHKPGEDVLVTVRRGGEVLEIKVRLGGRGG